MNKRIIAWTLFDFANSSYSVIIAAVIFPVYYATVIVGNKAGLGDLWWGRAISLSMFLVAMTSPFMGGIADTSGRRKLFLVLYTITAIVSVTLFTTLKAGMALYGFVLIVIANLGVEGGFVFYNAYLPVITDRNNVGRVSALGFGVGYAGSIISLLIALYFIKRGIINAVWIEVALLFSLFSLPLFMSMPADNRIEGIKGAAIGGLVQTIRSIREMISKKDSRLFLLSYFLYIDGVNTVIVFSSIFAVTTLGFTNSEIVILFMIVQGFALFGAVAISFFTDRVGPKRIVQVSILIWIIVAASAYFVESKSGFYLIASLAGSVLGCIQAASRALFSLFVPDGREAEFFGSYATVGKTSSILGPLIFGSLSTLFGNQRPAILSVAILFILGYIFLLPVQNRTS
jgi:UMF1 family MFS transporter